MRYAEERGYPDGSEEIAQLNSQLTAALEREKALREALTACVNWVGPDGDGIHDPELSLAKQALAAYRAANEK